MFINIIFELRIILALLLIHSRLPQTIKWRFVTRWGHYSIIGATASNINVGKLIEGGRCIWIDVQILLCRLWEIVAKVYGSIFSRSLRHSWEMTRFCCNWFLWSSIELVRLLLFFVKKSVYLRSVSATHTHEGLIKLLLTSKAFWKYIALTFCVWSFAHCSLFSQLSLSNRWWFVNEILLTLSICFSFGNRWLWITCRRLLYEDLAWNDVNAALSFLNLSTCQYMTQKLWFKPLFDRLRNM